MRYFLPFAGTCALLLAAAGFSFGQRAVPREDPWTERFAHFRHYTMAQGLSNNWVRAIAQDEDGFMWFGTEDGLNRFDGERFRCFYYQQDGQGLPSNTIINLLALPGHRLLVGTNKGLCVLHTRSARIERVGLLPNPHPGAADSIVLKLLRDRLLRIWVGTGTSIQVLDTALHAIHACWAPQPAGNNLPSAMYFARDLLELPGGAVLFKGQAEGLGAGWQAPDFERNTLRPATSAWPRYGILDSLPDAQFCVAENERILWYTTKDPRCPDGLYRYDWATATSARIWPPAGPVAAQADFFILPALLPDSALFLQRHIGHPAVYDLRAGRLTEIPLWNGSLPDGKTAATCLDREGQFWACPRNEGIYFFSLKSSPVQPLYRLNALHELRSARFYQHEWFGFGASEYRGRYLFYCPSGGLYIQEKSSGKVSAVAGAGGAGTPFTYAGSLAPYAGDTVWMTTLGGLAWLNIANGTMGKVLRPGPDSIAAEFIFRDSRGLLWGKVWRNGVACFDPVSGRFQHYPGRGEHPVFPLLSASAVAEDPRGDLWFAFAVGDCLVRWERATGVFRRVEAINPTGLNYTRAQMLRADPRGNIWIYAQEGVFVLDTHSWELRNLGKSNGLTANAIEGWAFDRRGNLWLATQYGLNRLDPRTGNVRVFYEQDGLLSNTILNVDLLDSARNILMVSTDKGICLFEPDKIPPSRPPPPMYLTDLRVSDRSLPIPENGAIGLPYYQNDIHIEYTGINFLDGDKNRYQYLLEGADNSWRDAGSLKSAFYPNLAPGTYTFRARVASIDGTWSPHEATLTIRIYPPFWQTFAFRLSFLFAAIGLGVWLYRRQIRLVERRESEKNAVQQQVADLEMKALRAQMNPHFVFNALNSVQNFILKNDTREASRYLTKFARLMRLILENSESPMVPLAREIELLRYYTELEQLRFNHRFAFDFYIDSQINPEAVAIPGMLIQPHIENAIWHGLMHKTEPGRLWVRFLWAGSKTIVCEIEDDGVGRSRASEIEKDRPKSHRSRGLANIRHRLDLLNAQLTDDIRLDFVDLTDDQGRARGTKVIVKIPAR